jgi:hypothetical protein
LLAIGANQPDRTDANLFVDALAAITARRMLTVSWTNDIPPLGNDKT